MADANEKLAIAALASISVGANRITSLTDGSAEAKIVNEAYEPLVNSEISLYKWRFATTEINLKPNLLADAPVNTRWDTQYQQPTDCLSVDTVLIGDVPINYERRGRKILTSGTSQDDVILKYRFRANELDWNPYFRQLIVYRLATMIAFSVQRNASVAEEMKDIADDHWRRAKTEDAQAQTNQKLRLNTLKSRRHGVDKFWRRR